MKKIFLASALVLIASPAFAFCDVSQDIGDFSNCLREERQQREMLENQQEMIEQQEEMIRLQEEANERLEEMDD